MNKKQYRKRRRANKIAKEERITVSEAFKFVEACQKVFAALGPLEYERKSRNAIPKLLAIIREMEKPLRRMVNGFEKDIATTPNSFAAKDAITALKKCEEIVNGEGK